MSSHDPSTVTTQLPNGKDPTTIAIVGIFGGTVRMITPTVYSADGSSVVTAGVCIDSTATYTADANRWVHWTFTWSSAGAPKFYRDGVEQATTTCADGYSSNINDGAGGTFAYTATGQLASHPHVVLNVATISASLGTAVLDEVRVFSSVVTSFQSTQQLTSSAGLLLSYTFDKPERLGFDSTCTSSDLAGDGGYGYGFGDAGSVYYRSGTDENDISRAMSVTGALCGATQVACCIPLNEKHLTHTRTSQVYGDLDYYHGAMTCTNVSGLSYAVCFIPF